MNKFLIWLFGVMVGAGVTYICTREKIKKDVEEENGELLSAIQESMEDRYKMKYEGKPEEKTADDESRPDTKPKSSIVKPDKERSKVQYTRAAEKIKEENGYSDPADKEFPTEEDIPRPKHVKKVGDPYIVTEEDVYDADTGYDCKVLHWDPAAVVLADDWGYEVDIADVGIENLRQLETTYVDDGLIFVRNDKEELDYEVYLGIPDP